MLRSILVILLFISVAAAAPRPRAKAARHRASVAAQEATAAEGRTVTSVEVIFEGAPRNAEAEAELRALLVTAPNTAYSVAQVRDSLYALYRSGRVANARVEAVNEGANGVRLLYYVRPQPRLADVVIALTRPPVAAPGGRDDAPFVSEDELRGRLNLLEPGRRVSDQALRQNADAIQVYLRDKGYYNASVDFTQQLDATGTRSTVTFNVQTGEVARVEAFNIDVPGFADSRVRPTLALQPNRPFSRAALGEDLNRLRQELIRLKYLAPQLNEPQVEFDAARNRVTVNLRGVVGPQVQVTVTGYQGFSDKGLRELLPVRREGNIDQSAIVEGERRLRNKLQEDGYFFAEVTPACTVTPPLVASESGSNGTFELCQNLTPAEVTGRLVTINYGIETGRRFKLTDIRIEGTNKLSYEDVADELRTQQATILGVIPYLGYGRGYTNRDFLEQDRRAIRNRMRDIGYRQADVAVRQGVSLDSENLIITFDVIEGPLTRLAGVEIRGNQIFTAERLRDERCRLGAPDEAGCLVLDGPYSRSQARTDGERIRSLYAREGYVDAGITYDVVELPKNSLGDERVRLIYTVTESDKVLINRILINGNVLTKREVLLNAIPLREGEVLRADQINDSERILYATGAYRQVVIRTEAAGENASGYKRSDVIIDLEEQKPRDLTYGGGYSTDNGPLGLFEYRYNNLFGRLQQGSIRVRASQRQQLLRLEFFDPRFRRYGTPTRFSPLSISAQYQRDTNVTRFFRTTIDRGNGGLVQRLNEKGEPIDITCAENDLANCPTTGEPTINRFTVTAETQRALDRAERNIVFLRYNYEDVRLFKTESLLISDILRPDRVVRLSQFGVTFVRDTRARRAEETSGDFLSVDYALALRQLGGNFSFQKFQANYRRYYKIDRLRGTVLAGNAILGLSNLLQVRDRDGNPGIDEADRLLPISERFFSGGSTTLRGFGFEEAGPRVVVVPQQKNSFDENGEPVILQPFTVPIGGNALAVLNGEARIPVTKTFQVVPFYDGGNVFRRVKDIFRSAVEPGEDPNLHARWTHTVGLGLRVRTPFGALGVDYGFLLNPPEFTLTEQQGGPATIRLKRAQFHLRFGQSF
ncbi:MAG TPA: POTRA domain-containing protein [Pyrinomonadaceae bacterium]|nr:POTRA domain-containing protein [Pyrinomonadaceae bacterium]